MRLNRDRAAIDGTRLVRVSIDDKILPPTLEKCRFDCWKCFERTILWLYDCEDKDRFRSRDLQFETISSTIESRLVKVERKNGDYLNGGYPNGCRDRDSQDRESESTLARHH